MLFKTKIVCIICFVLTALKLFSQCPDGYTSVGTERAVNGDFNSGNTGFTSSYTYEANNADPSVKTELWSEGTYSVYSNPNDLHSGFSACTDMSGSGGNMMIVNGSSVANVPLWTQTITVSASTLYYFVTEVTSVNSASPAQLQFSVNNVLLGSIFNASATTCQWNKFYATWNSAGNTSATISIVNQNTASTGNDFALDKISFIPCTATLPIDLLNFEIIRNSCNEADVLWQTASETNNDYFTVERSIAGQRFDSLTTVKSKGSNSKSLLQYSFRDNQPDRGISYYRLKQTDIDGKSKYSNVVSLNACSLDTVVDVSVYPNPSYNRVGIHYSGNIKDITSVYLFNVYGETVYESSQFQSELDFENLTSGLYIVQIDFASHKTIEKRFIVK